MMEEHAEVFCINCDRKVDFDTRETTDGFYEAYCKTCGEELYIPELNDFNARLRNIREKRKRMLFANIEEIIDMTE